MRKQTRNRTIWTATMIMALVMMAAGQASILGSDPGNDLIGDSFEGAWQEGEAFLGTIYDELHIASGTAAWVSGPLRAGTLRIDGDLHSTIGDLVIHAGTIHVGPEGRLRAPSGEPGDFSQASLALGGRGADGASIRIYADVMNLHPESTILAGSGGAGGSAIGALGGATGGAGGFGGSVVIQAAVVHGLDSQLHAGAGGAGGHAVIDATAGNSSFVGAALGGRGGDSGTVTVNGIPHFGTGDPIPAPPSASAPWPVNPLDCGPSQEGDDPAVSAPCVPTSSASSSPSPTEGLTTLCGVGPGTDDMGIPGSLAMSCGALLAALAGIVEKITELPTWKAPDCLKRLEYSIVNGSSDPVAPESCLKILVEILEWLELCETLSEIGLGGDADIFGEYGVTVNVDCEGIRQVIKEELEAEDDGGTGRPGQPGTASATCLRPVGEEGTPDPTPPAGDGGAGGHACSHVSGNGDVGDGGKGKSRPRGCTAGGQGGAAADVTSGHVQGGNGGLGFRNGGDGGDASSRAFADDGGAGGPGGASWGGGTTCPGGNGGPGGNAFSGNAVAGNGGTGLCGKGGYGGLATSAAKPGAGGPGGSGTPPGIYGLKGEGAAGTTKSGEGGLGPNLC